MILNSFLEKFFQQNPISKREGGLILVKDKKAERFVSLTGYIRVLKESLASLKLYVVATTRFRMLCSLFLRI